jgi:DinB superfamily
MLDSAIQANLALMQLCRALVEDIADERMAEQPVADVNHPAWILGHLAWTADRILEMFGAPVTTPAEWATLFSRGSTPSASRAAYASKDELLRAVDHAYQQLRQNVASASSEQLSRPTTNPRLKDTLPTLKELSTFLMTGHVGMHLGQLSTWRRLIGRPPLF